MFKPVHVYNALRIIAASNKKANPSHNTFAQIIFKLEPPLFAYFWHIDPNIFQQFNQSANDGQPICTI